MTIVLENISLTATGVPYIYESNLTLEKKSLNVLLGPTLSGKTSLMRILAGLERPTKGKIFVDGVDVTGVGVRKRNIAMVYQEFINYSSHTVYDNIASPLRLQKLKKSEIDDKVNETAKILHIDSMLDRYPSELSGGQQQRCAMARAFVKDAGLLMLDEPLVNLDYKLREELRDEMQEIFKKRDTIVVYATTDPLEALRLGGNTIVLREGRVAQHGPTLDVFYYPKNVAAGITFSDPPMNIIEVSIKEKDGKKMGFLPDGTKFEVTGHLGELGSGKYQFGVRCMNIGLKPFNGHNIKISGEVDLAEISGSETFIHVKHENVNVVSQSEGAHPRRIGDHIDIFLNHDFIYAFDMEGDLLLAPDRNGSTSPQS